nr:aldose epimerase family protein [Allomuricauda sp.]
MTASQALIHIGGKPIEEITLSNESGCSIKLLALGATLDSFMIPLKNGTLKELVVSPENKEYYLEQFHHVPYYFGATVGRYAGRLGKPSIEINGTTYLLEEDEDIHLHGGKQGLSKKVWDVKQLKPDSNPSATFSYGSAHLEGGYPGHLKVEAKYTLHQDNSLEILYTAVSDQDTILNLTNHVYFNLGYSSVLNQLLKIDGDHILETNNNLVPTGKRIPVTDSAYDFRNERRINRILNIDGLDTTYCFGQYDMESPKVIYGAEDTRLKMEVFTNQKSAVVFAPPKLIYKKGTTFQNFSKNDFPSICFEMQNYPDSPNHPSFPSALLRKGEVYENRVIYKVTGNL